MAEAISEPMASAAQTAPLFRVIEPEGVRMRRDDVMLYDGADSCDQLFDDIRRSYLAP